MPTEQNGREIPHFPIDDVETEEASTDFGDSVATTEVFAPSKWTVTSVSPFSTSWEWTGVGDYTALHNVGDRDWADDSLTIDGETVLEGSVGKEEAALELKEWGESRELTELAEVIESDDLARTYFKRSLNEERPQHPTVEVPAELLAELAANAGRHNWVVASPAMEEARKILTEANDGE